MSYLKPKSRTAGEGTAWHIHKEEIKKGLKLRPRFYPITQFSYLHLNEFGVTSPDGHDTFSAGQLAVAVRGDGESFELEAGQCGPKSACFKLFNLTDHNHYPAAVAEHLRKLGFKVRQCDWFRDEDGRVSKEIFIRVDQSESQRIMESKTWPKDLLIALFEEEPPLHWNDELELNYRHA